MPTLQLIIKGKVQGVFYRASAKDIAKAAGITGWIKNTKDGNVEAVISGAAEQTQDFIKWCKLGPRTARVTDVEVITIADEVFEGFEILK